MVATTARTMHEIVDPKRVAELTAREEKHLNDESGGSARMYERAKASMVNGVASSYQVRDPWPIYLSDGHGSKVWDVDGNEMVDFHNGFGSMVQGHAHPAIVEAVQDGSPGAPTSRRRSKTRSSSARSWRGGSACRSGAMSTPVPKRRWTRSGSRAAFTGRDTIVKIFGSYHGHHDYAMVSIGVPYENIGDRTTTPRSPTAPAFPSASPI